ncbi:MAG: DUF1311 domain-containing protein [Alphaproteobacteria bacterium]|nr:DUF1311 domain-containing protein [Alphaproteobacteria bacterium]
MTRTVHSLCVSLALVFAGVMTVSAEPSFDCAKAQSAAESTICGAEALQWLDRQLARLFAQVKASVTGEDRADLLASQKAFLAARDACPAAYECIAAVYHKRLKELADMTGFPESYRQYHMDGEVRGDMTIVRIGDSGAVDIATIGGGDHTCVAEFDRGVISGKGVITGKLGEEAEACTITITPNGENMDVVTQHCDAYCGMRATIDGQYEAVPR